jgi:ABC-2 family transporter protein
VIWLTWRQHRSEALVLGGLLLVAAAAFTLERLAMSNAIDQLGLANCASLASGSCADAAGRFLQQYDVLTPTAFLTLVPGAVGMFVGAPLVARELDRRTHWLVWSQDVSRGRWLLVKSAGVLLLSVAAVGVFTLALTWMLGTFFQVATPVRDFSPFDPFFFDVEGVVPVAVAVFALALGMAAGALLARPLPAMLIVLAVFCGLRFGIAQVRFDYPPAPVTMTASLTTTLPEVPSGAWETGRVLLDARDNPVPRQSVCDTRSGAGKPACDGVHWLVTYQPADRFWSFQAIESGVYLVLSVLLLAFTAYWVRRRIT